MYQHQETRYEITVENPNGATRGIAMLELDGKSQLEGNSVILKNDGQLHHVRIVMG
jgi:cyclic beta-1,2-glucan synthetase